MFHRKYHKFTGRDQLEGAAFTETLTGVMRGCSLRRVGVWLRPAPGVGGGVLHRGPAGVAAGGAVSMVLDRPVTTAGSPFWMLARNEEFPESDETGSTSGVDFLGFPVIPGGVDELGKSREQ